MEAWFGMDSKCCYYNIIQRGDDVVVAVVVLPSHLFYDEQLYITS